MGLGPRGTFRLQVLWVSQEPLFSFRILREEVEKQAGNRIGCTVARSWNLPERGWGRQRLFRCPVSLGHFSSAAFLTFAFGMSLKHQQNQVMFPVSGRRKRNGRMRKSSTLLAVFVCF